MRKIYMDLAITFDRHSSLPLHQQLYEELRQVILSGRLLPRQKVPSTRSMAKSLGISRTTVTQSYDQLLSEGYLETIAGSGTYVCAQLPDDLLHSDSMAVEPNSTPLPIQLSHYGDCLSQTPFTLQPSLDLPISFRYGQPALQHFPIALWRKLLSRYCMAASDWLDYTTDFQGYRPLRQAIARYLGRARAVQCDPEQIIMTNGTQQALDLVMRLLINPGDGIAIEDPGYLSARRVFLSHQAKLFPVPVDESGLIVEKLTDLASDSLRLVYVTPSHQFPTGAILSLARRLELLAWAQQTKALILEDDYDSEYRYGERPIPALQGLDCHHSVIYVGTFSKVLFPSLRMGYLVVPQPLVPLLAQAKWLSDRQLPTLEQQVLTEFIEAGHLESHIRKMRSHYDQLRQTLVQALKSHFGDLVDIFGETAGIHVMVKLHTPWSDAEVIERAVQVGVGLMSAQPHYFSPDDQGEFIFGYGDLNEEQISAGIACLAQALGNRSFK
ncbi:PLP-dependent aminotransferase family protein [Phormidium sp. CLA17]|uniref:MocR-like pyridoxine biosynthesis transcription factor PdxR n=1 Tax=Leptolyngbya sp. Cla-17 TaxID=2803751 RepID=UPI0018D9868B|nr:PLP-dependent aminotransferase family protein [Leptolyngbya sp. Cla-17]MBM0744313.1 PLP-dependent aminotransferase family protein [Leptolyngbya sp. Cla-17]